MWLVTTLVAAIAVTAMWLTLPKNRYKLDFLAVMLWGLGLMIFVDHILGYRGGPFLEAETDGLVQNGAVLGILMLIPVIAIWTVYLGLSMCKKKTVKG